MWPDLPGWGSEGFAPHFWRDMAIGTVVIVAALWVWGCANEAAERTLWQECGVTHEECWQDTWDSRTARDCEYEFYKECVNE